MQPFPVEIWTRIINDHLLPDDIPRLSQTCAFFHTISQETLYRNISLSGNTYHPPLLQLARSLADRPELGRFVQRLSIVVPHFGELGFRNAISHPVLESIALFSNLQILDVCGFYVDPRFISALHSLPRLRTVSFEACKFDSDYTPTETPVQIPANSSIAEIIIRSSLFLGPVGMALGTAQLRSFEIFEDRNPAAYLDNNMLFTWLDTGKNHTLTTLRFTSKMPWFIVNLLESLPQLRSLSLPNTERESRSSFYERMSLLSTDAIPLLEDFKGPEECTARLIRHRPVDTVEMVLAPESPMDILLCLQESSVPVTKLALSGDMSGLEMQRILERLPITLHQFCCYSDEAGPAQIISWLPALSRLKNLRVFKVKTKKYVWKKEDVEAISEECPSIQEYHFFRFYFNARVDTWRYCKQCGWELFHYELPGRI